MNDRTGLRADEIRALASKISNRRMLALMKAWDWEELNTKAGWTEMRSPHGIKLEMRSAHWSQGNPAARIQQAVELTLVPQEQFFAKLADLGKEPDPALGKGEVYVRDLKPGMWVQNLDGPDDLIDVRRRVEDVSEQNGVVYLKLRGSQRGLDLPPDTPVKTFPEEKAAPAAAKPAKPAKKPAKPAVKESTPVNKPVQKSQQPQQQRPKKPQRPRVATERYVLQALLKLRPGQPVSIDEIHAEAIRLSGGKSLLHTTIHQGLTRNPMVEHVGGGMWRWTGYVPPVPKAPEPEPVLEPEVVETSREVAIVTQLQNPEVMNELLDLMFPKGFKARHLPAIEAWKQATTTLIHEVGEQ